MKDIVAKSKIFLRRMGWGASSAQQQQNCAEETIANVSARKQNESANNRRSLGVVANGVAVTPRNQREKPRQSSMFLFMGEDWSDEFCTKPILVLWGCYLKNREFMIRYLSDEYRIAFARGKTPWELQKESLDQMNNLVFGFCGQRDEPDVQAYACTRGIKVLRINDGFIIGTEPLSLIVDSVDIYGNQVSDLENRLLSQHIDKKMLEAASTLRKVFLGLRVSSENNSAEFRSTFSILGPKIRQRVLVLGHAEKSTTSEDENLNSWTNEEIIRLAKEENPHAELLYKPHADVAKVLKRPNSKSLKELQTVCRVLLEDVMLADLLSTVDHAYTLNTLGGMEALLHECKVTVLGKPFYAGWGLTDDRAVGFKRERNLSLDELFYGTYLTGSRYLTHKEDAVVGCLAAMFRVTAQRKQHLFGQINARTAKRRAAWIAASEYWPALFRAELLPTLVADYGRKLFTILPIQKYFSVSESPRFKRSLAYFLVGQLHATPAYGSLLAHLRGLISADAFSSLLCDLWRMKPSNVVLDQWAAHSESLGNHEQVREALDQLAFGDKAALNKVDASLPIAPANQGYVLKLAQYELRRRNFDQAEQLLNNLLISGNMSGEVFSNLAEIARLKFDFLSANNLMEVLNHAVPNWKVGRGFFIQAQVASLSASSWKALEVLSYSCVVNPQHVESVVSVVDVLERTLGLLPYAEAMQAAVDVVDSGSIIARAKNLITHNKAAHAEARLLKYTPTTAETIKYCLVLSQAYSYQGKLEEAKSLIKNLLPFQPALLVYREGLRLSVLKNDYEWGQELLNDAAIRDLDVGDIFHRKIRLGLGDIKGSYLSFRDMRAKNIIGAYTGTRYTQDLLGISAGKKSLIIGFFGPGDEIRFASFYRAFASSSHSGNELKFTCDPRIHPLLARGYPELDFVPTARIRSLAWLDDLSSFKELPGSDLHTFFDNKGWQAVQQADKVSLVTDLLGDVIEGYESFSGEPYLKADPGQISAWSTRLEPWSDKPLIGLSWRSSLTTYSRNEHYLAIEDLVPLLELDGVQFVNLQYDDCAEELAWVEKHFPGKLINFPDLDQYNDLDGVSALMRNVDLVIAPATTVVELAGALGCPALLLSNSSELHWRKRPGSTVDVWHKSIRHVEGESVGDKASLVQAVHAELLQFVQNFHVRTKEQIDEQGIDRAEFWRNYSKAKATSMGKVWRDEALTIEVGRRMINSLNTFIPADKQTRVLDVGCGTGEVSCLLAEAGYQVTGLDISENLAHEFRKNTEHLGIDLMVGDVLTMPAQPIFDAVVARFVFSHYTDFGRLLAGMARFVKPGGVIVFDSFSKEALEFAATVTGKTKAELAEKVFGSLACFSTVEIESVCRVNGWKLEQRTPLDFFHRNPLLATAYVDQAQIDMSLKGHYGVAPVRDFMTWLNSSVSQSLDSRFAGLLINIVRV